MIFNRFNDSRRRKSLVKICDYCESCSRYWESFPIKRRLPPDHFELITTADWRWGLLNEKCSMRIAHWKFLSMDYSMKTPQWSIFSPTERRCDFLQICCCLQFGSRWSRCSDWWSRWETRSLKASLERSRDFRKALIKAFGSFASEIEQLSNWGRLHLAMTLQTRSSKLELFNWDLIGAASHHHKRSQVIKGISAMHSMIAISIVAAIVIAIVTLTAMVTVQMLSGRYGSCFLGALDHPCLDAI